MGKNIWQRIYDLLWLNPFQLWFIRILIVINVLGSVYGYYWYRYQLLSTSKIFWPFIPDSPLATTLTALALILFLYNKRNSFFEWIAYTSVIKYGIWAVIIISHYGLTGGHIQPEIWMLWFSHLGMAAQGLVFLRHVRVSRREVAAGTAWMLFNDLLDYGLGIYPYLYASYQWPVAIVAAFGLTLGINLSKLPAIVKGYSTFRRE